MGLAAALGALGLLTACGGASGEVSPVTSAAVAASSAPPSAPPTAPPASTTVPQATTVPPTTVPPTTSTTAAPAVLQRLVLGHSVEGREIQAVERGARGGRVVLVIGCIHGDEAAGAAVADDLTTVPVPAGIDLWVVPTMNPDGEAHGTRTNAHEVDLNRNFPYRWAPLGQPGDSQYAGTAAASEPETKAVVDLIERIKPELTIWYHQDLNRIAPAKGRAGRIRQRYADLTGLPVLPVTGGTYTGTASPWAQTKVNGVAFIVELGPTLGDEQALTHARAVLTVAGELGSV